MPTPSKRKFSRPKKLNIENLYRIPSDITIAKSEEIIEERSKTLGHVDLKLGRVLKPKTLQLLSGYINSLKLEEVFLLFGFTCYVDGEAYCIEFHFKDSTFTVVFLANDSNQFVLEETTIPLYILDAQALFEKHEGNLMNFLHAIDLLLDCFCERRELYLHIKEKCSPEKFAIQTNESFTEFHVLISVKSKEVEVKYSFARDSFTPVIEVVVAKGKLRKLQKQKITSILHGLPYWNALLDSAMVLEG